MSSEQKAPTPRVNMRMVARRAGVSLGTVSFALRNSPRIPSATRERVRRAAQELGYKPDPNLAKLMHHLRAKRPPGYQSTLCAITTIPDQQRLAYMQQMIASATAAAEALGYKMMFVSIDDAVERRPDLQRVLLSRGVEGIVLLPMLVARSFRTLLDWSKFAVVATTNGVLAPEFHRVVPHQFGNTLTLCQELVRRGYRRIGTVLNAQHDATSQHGFSAAVIWQNALGGTERVRPLIFDGERPLGLKRWFARERPDALVLAGEREARLVVTELGLRVPGPVGFVTTNRSGASVFAGIEERPAEIGTTAVRLLASLLQHGEKGIPAVPTVTMVRGEWVETKSVRRARLARGTRRVAPAQTSPAR
jgi:DNA-binding LacI/PurR family transcriptional regulator